MLRFVIMNIDDFMGKPEAFRIVEGMVDGEIEQDRQGHNKGNPKEGTLHQYLWNLDNRITYLRGLPGYKAVANLSTEASIDVSESIEIAGLLANMGSNVAQLADFRKRCVENIGESTLITLEGYCDMADGTDASIANANLGAIRSIINHLDAYAKTKRAEFRVERGW